MKLNKINLYAYRTIAILIIAFLLVGGSGMFLEHFYYKGLVAVVAAFSIAWLAFRKPSVISWVLTVLILFVAMYLVPLIEN